VSAFQAFSAYVGDPDYEILPLRFRRFPGRGSVLITNDIGEHLWLDRASFDDFVHHRLTPSSSIFWDLEARYFLKRRGQPLPLESMAIQYRSRKSFLLDGPALHIFVVTLRCNHSCRYCQVSRQLEGEGSSAFDMTLADVEHAVAHVLTSPASHVTVEFQGGEPLLAFDVIRLAVEMLEAKKDAAGKSIRYVITSVLHHLDDRVLEFIARHHIELSTSLDGPEGLHNTNRPIPSRDSYARTLNGIARAREALGYDAVAALTTITRDSLGYPEAIVDAYREHGFHSIFLRPLSPYGFAARSTRMSYSTAEFVAFYRRAFEYLLKVNRDGYPMDEAYAALLLRSILTPFGHGHVDLRSPAGAGFGALVYNYDGRVYPSDEARMLAAMGDETFCLGHVTDDYESLLRSPAMQLVASGAVAESIPGCADCAYLPYCGSDPIDSYRRQGDVIGHRPSSPFCQRQLGVLDYLFGKLHDADPTDLQIFQSWISRRAPRRTDSEHGDTARP
jgi:His-Xaa-Ser system radical SAM maturase HxsB